MREMFFKRKNELFSRIIVFVLCGALLGLTWPDVTSADSSMAEGVRTPAEAASIDLNGKIDGLFKFVNWRPAPSFLASSAYADTTDLEFPEDEETNQKNLVRDVGIFIVLSAFVGFFLIKVFLEGDTQQPPDDDNGKEIP